MTYKVVATFMILLSSTELHIQNASEEELVIKEIAKNLYSKDTKIRSQAEHTLVKFSNLHLVLQVLQSEMKEAIDSNNRDTKQRIEQVVSKVSFRQNLGQTLCNSLDDETVEQLQTYDNKEVIQFLDNWVMKSDRAKFLSQIKIEGSPDLDTQNQDVVNCLIDWAYKKSSDVTYKINIIGLLCKGKYIKSDSISSGFVFYIKDSTRHLAKFLHDQSYDVASMSLTKMIQFCGKEPIGDFFTYAKQGRFSTLRLRIIDYLLQRWFTETEDKGLIHTCLNDDDYSIRAGIVESLSKANATKYSDEIAKLIRDTNDNVKKSAILALGRLQSNKHTKDIFDTIISTNPLLNIELTCAALRTLGTLQSKEYEQDVANLLENELVRGCAIQALGLYKSAQFKKQIVGYLDDEDDNTRATAIEFLTKTGDVKYKDQTISCLNDQSARVRVASIKAIDAFNAKEYTDDLIKLLNDQAITREDCHGEICHVYSIAERVLKKWGVNTKQKDKK
ncbi:MAG: HEAT repeat domain-containing protein [Planctomycetes bacterium]|nr:HEAT repeat domain-containing protein [Planctomycetota bacterium]